MEHAAVLGVSQEIIDAIDQAQPEPEYVWRAGVTIFEGHPSGRVATWFASGCTSELGAWRLRASDLAHQPSQPYAPAPFRMLLCDALAKASAEHRAYFSLLDDEGNEVRRWVLG